MNPDYKDGYLKVDGDWINLYDTNDIIVSDLYNFKTETSSTKYKVYMPKDFYIPTLIPRKTRYLLHNSDLILLQI